MNDLSQSAASQQIQELERSLGVELFDRSRRPLAVTDAGKLYLEYCRDVLRRHDHYLADQLSSPPQTNEVARSGIVLGAMLHVAARTGLPLEIFEIGASAGLNLAFDEYVFDLAPYVNTQQTLHYKISDRYLHELLFPDLTQTWEQHERKAMLAEAHARLSAPLYNLAFMAMVLEGRVDASELESIRRRAE